MKIRKTILTATLPAVFVAAAAFQTAAQAAPNTLTAVKADTAPVLDGVADDPVWQSAAAVELNFGKGENFGGTGKTSGTIKAARVGDMLYMVLQYQDPTHSQQRMPYVKQADGSWKKLKDPDDKGGDNNKVYEDKSALIWPIGDSIADFDSDGCFAACHDDEPPKPYGNKYTEKEGEMGDIWHVKTVRTGPVGQIHDQYLDHMRFDQEKNKGAGRHGDPKTGGGYKNIELKDGKPEFMNKDGKAANKGGTYWLKAEDKAPFDDSRFEPGDEVASIMVAPFEGDAGDIAAGMAWKDGVWTVEMARKLVTGSKYDVQFDDLNKGYLFGVSAFDNAQVRHAFIKRPVTLVFEP
ncbi:MAG: ethylbenzene dehydrogenase [Chromatiaceae bacterium]|nr:ethylbenzene dehydrogenase [Gammaproteobacteria bacterium]MCP5316256.1 ethylbenzene dehydrogenase [Chromatiaceae bacterium]